MTSRLMIKALDGAQNYTSRLEALGESNSMNDISKESMTAFEYYGEATTFLETCRSEYSDVLDKDSDFRAITRVYVDTVNYYKRVVRGIAYKYAHMAVIRNTEANEDIRLVSKLDNWLRSYDLAYRYAVSDIKELNLITVPRYIGADIEAAIHILNNATGPQGVLNMLVIFLEDLRESFNELEEWRMETNG